jgi:hypothetical protein
MRQFVTSSVASLVILFAGNAGATAITFDTTPTDTTYLSSGLLLGLRTALTRAACAAAHRRVASARVVASPAR